MVLEHHPDFSALYACLQELAPIPRSSHSYGSNASSASEKVSSPQFQNPQSLSPSPVTRPHVAKMTMGGKALRRTVATMSTGGKPPIRQIPRFAASLDDHLHASELDASVPVTIMLYLEVCHCSHSVFDDC
jgi:hypothetical protein